MSSDMDIFYDSQEENDYDNEDDDPYRFVIQFICSKKWIGVMSKIYTKYNKTFIMWRKYHCKESVII